MQRSQTTRDTVTGLGIVNLCVLVKSWPWKLAQGTTRGVERIAGIW